MNRLDEIVRDVARNLAGPEWMDRLRIWLHHGLSKRAKQMIIERWQAWRRLGS